MKKFLTVVLIILIINIVGCGSSKYSDETYLEERVFFVDDKENIDDFIEGAGRNYNSEFDEEFLQQMLLEGRIKFSDKEVKVAVTDEIKGGKIVEIKFLQGRYKNKTGYVFPEFIVDVKREKEKAEKEQKETIAFEELTIEDKKSYNSIMHDGVRFNLSVVEPKASYGQIEGETNLPDGTKITVSAVETIVRKGKIAVTLGAPPGKEVSVKILKGKEQPVNVRTINAEIIKSKGDNYGILNKEFTVQVR